MKRLYILAEGPTEETFIKELLAPHHERMGLSITPILFATSPGHKGGIKSYESIKRQIIRLCRQDKGAAVSTFIDLYGLPSDFPGKSHPAFPAKGSGQQKAAFIEKLIAQNVGEHNFLPYLMAHEYEALLFVAPEYFKEWADDDKTIAGLTAITQAYATPEDINDSPMTAPSKRIKRLMPQYQKTFHGPLIACDIGLDALRQACPHFNDWLNRLEQLAA